MRVVLEIAQRKAVMADQPQEVENTPSPTPGENEQPGTPGQDLPAETGSQPDNLTQEPEESSAAQKRIQRLAADKRRLATEAAHWKSIASRLAQVDDAATRTANQVSPAYPENEVEQAFSTLKGRGMVTRDELQDLVTRIEWDRQHDKNEAEVNRTGSNMPKYDRQEVESYARERGIPDPMAAYRDMYFDEIVDSARRGKPRAASVATARPSRPDDVSREPMTLDIFRDNLRKGGREYYEQLAKDPEKFDELLQQLGK